MKVPIIIKQATQELVKEAISLQMMRSNAYRNLGKMVTGGKKAILPAMENMASAGNLTKRELMATRGASSPEFMKLLAKRTRQYERLGKLFGKTQYGASAKAGHSYLNNMYADIKRGMPR